MQGRLEQNILTLWVENDFIKTMVSTPGLLDTLGSLASAQTGCSVRCSVKISQAPPASVQPAPAQPGPAAPPPEHDKLDDLLALGAQLGGIVVEE